MEKALMVVTMLKKNKMGKKRKNKGRNKKCFYYLPQSFLKVPG